MPPLPILWAEFSGSLDPLLLQNSQSSEPGALYSPQEILPCFPGKTHTGLRQSDSKSHVGWSTRQGNSL